MKKGIIWDFIDIIAIIAAGILVMVCCVTDISFCNVVGGVCIIAGVTIGMIYFVKDFREFRRVNKG